MKLEQLCTKNCHGPELISASKTACSREHYEFDPQFFLLCNDHPKWESERTEWLSCQKISENTSIPI